MALYYCGQCNTDQETEKWPSGVDKIRAFSPEEIVRCLDCGHSVPVDQEPTTKTNDEGESLKAAQEYSVGSSIQDSGASDEQDNHPFNYESFRERMREERKRERKGNFVLLILLLSFLVALVWGIRFVVNRGSDLLANYGMVSYERETMFIAPANLSNWLPGETRHCESVPLSKTDAAAVHKQIGYALYAINCGSGSIHDIKISFYGKPVEPQYLIVHWRCSRNQRPLFGGGTTFTCKQAGGVLKQSGGSRS